MPRRVATASRRRSSRSWRCSRWPAWPCSPLSGLTGCERAPEPPVWDNPFDPTGPEDGDPLNLRVMMNSGQVTLAWAQPQGMGIVQYAISHSEQPDTGWSSLALVDATSSPEYLYPVTAPTPTQTDWYRVQAVGADGLASLVDYATPADPARAPRHPQRQRHVRRLAQRDDESRGLAGHHAARGPGSATMPPRPPTRRRHPAIRP